MIKLIISDLDGTLLHDHATIHDTDIQALRRAQEQGVAVAFASGRMYPEIQEVANSIGMQVHAVSQNGAYAHLADGTRIKADYFPRERGKKAAGGNAGQLERKGRKSHAHSD